MTCNNGVEFIILFSIFSIHLVVNYINSLIICGLRVLNLAIVMNTLSFHVTLGKMAASPGDGTRQHGGRRHTHSLRLGNFLLRLTFF